MNVLKSAGKFLGYGLLYAVFTALFVVWTFPEEHEEEQHDHIFARASRTIEVEELAEPRAAAGAAGHAPQQPNH